MATARSAGGPSACGKGLGGHLEALYRSCDRRLLHTDPVAIPRRFPDPADREVAAFITSALAYGRVSHIRASVERLLTTLGDRPAAALLAYDPRRGKRALAGFVHRFNDARDAALLLHFVSQMLRESGSIEEFFREGDDASAPEIGSGLAAFTRRALKLDCTPWYRSGRLPAAAGVRFFFPSPEDGSACKRMAMFLRWMVRPDDGIDMGLWRLPPSRLVVPLDTHVFRVAAFLGLTDRRSADWAAALEVTAGLRDLDPHDPVRYDFSLCRLGMLAGFPQRAGLAGTGGCPLCAATALAAAS